MRYVALLCLAACGGTDSSDTDARRRFVEKAAHALHPSAAPLAASEVDALAAQSDEDIVATLYADPATRDAVFRISLQFLGAPIDQLRSDGRWAPMPFVYAPAVASARAFGDGGDPLASLLTTRSYAATGVAVPVRDDLLAAFYGAPPLTGTNAQRRAIAAQYIDNDFVQLRAYVASVPDPFDTKTVCDTYVMTNASVIAFQIADILGVPTPITTGGYPQEVGDPDAFPLDYACQTGQPTTRAIALQHIDHGRALAQQLVARLEPLFARWDANPDGAFEPADFAALGFVSYADAQYGSRSQFYPQFWDAAQNSSTNFNRRRGAYMLERYFCDDLKPVGAALPADHGGGKHASDPGCAACHFKLDPMAGFFRRHGYRGTEYTDQVLQQTGGMITFDDLATAPFSGYQAAWTQIGYIRSTRDPSLNSYGNTLDDLDTLLQTAPEVERCFAQRVFEYFNGNDQAVDPGFLDDVAADLHGRGGERLERAVVRVLTGKTFQAADRSSTVCYDLAPGTDPSHRPPCEVASILHASCTSCHGGANPQSGLDLTVWEKLDGGFGFRHVVDGVQLPRAETFARMRDRVMTSDLARQMPQGKDMPLRAREQLALWLQNIAN